MKISAFYERRNLSHTLLRKLCVFLLGNFRIGGDGTVGTVSGVDGGKGTKGSWVTVHWPDRTNNNYRRGHEGKMDLKYTERDTGGQFYIEHLPNLG